MASSLTALLLAGLLVLGPTAGTETAASKRNEPVKVRLDVDAGSLGADQSVAEPIAAAVGKKLAQEGITVDPRQALAVSIRVRRFSPKAVADFFVDVQLTRDGEVLESLETSGCAKCIDGFLVDHVVGRVPEIGKRVRAAQESANQDGGTTSPADGQTASEGRGSTNPAPPLETSEPSRTKRDVAFIAGGAAGCAVGLGTLLGGVLVWADGTGVRGSSTKPQQLEGTDRRGIGYGLIGTGTVMIAAGTALIVVGSLRRGKARRSRASLAPAVGSSTWGLSVSGRF
jgi:hypothetical protein